MAGGRPPHPFPSPPPDVLEIIADVTEYWSVSTEQNKPYKPSEKVCSLPPCQPLAWWARGRCAGKREQRWIFIIIVWSILRLPRRFCNKVRYFWLKMSGGCCFCSPCWRLEPLDVRRPPLSLALASDGKSPRGIQASGLPHVNNTESSLCPQKERLVSRDWHRRENDLANCRF